MATFDARPVIAAGGEPFSDIMTALAALGGKRNWLCSRHSSRYLWRAC